MNQHESDISVLLIEDNEDHIELFKKMFERLPSTNGSLSNVRTLAEGIAFAQRESTHLVFLDLGLPDCTGIETLSKFMQEVRECPVIVLTAMKDIETGIQSVKIGAQDFLVKGDFSSSLLERVMRYAIERQCHLHELEKQNEEIRVALQEKDLLLKEVHHRVKNNLQVISSLLRLQADSCKEPVAKDLLKASDNRVKSMALVHERMYKAMCFSSVDFSAYAEEIGHHLIISLSPGQPMNLQLDLHPVTLAVDKAIPAGLILNELIANSVKHAFSKNQVGSIKISLQEVDDMISLKVSDDGRGLPDGFDPYSGQSLGYDIITALASQLKGQLFTGNENGAWVELRFSNITEKLTGSYMTETPVGQ